MNRFPLVFLASAATCLASIHLAYGEESMSQDKQFAAAVASKNMLEIRLGQYVSDRGSNNEVRRFAEQMINDHQKAKNLLEKIASEKGVELPYTLNEQDQETLDRLEKLSGSGLDQAYVKQMVVDHEAAIKTAESESRDGTVDEMKLVAMKILPTLQHHLKMANSLAAAERSASTSAK